MYDDERCPLVGTLRADHLDPAGDTEHLGGVVERDERFTLLLLDVAVVPHR